MAASPVAAAQTARKLPFDVLLVKGSRGIALDRCVESLLEYDPEKISGLAPFALEQQENE